MPKACMPTMRWPKAAGTGAETYQPPPPPPPLPPPEEPPPEEPPEDEDELAGGVDALALALTRLELRAPLKALGELKLLRALYQSGWYSCRLGSTRPASSAAAKRALHCASTPSAMA